MKYNSKNTCNGLTELTNIEIWNIDGGGWLEDFGAWTHRTVCKISDAISSGSEALSRKMERDSKNPYYMHPGKI